MISWWPVARRLPGSLIRFVSESGRDSPRVAERPVHVQTTDLVHEAYLRLVDVERVQHWDSRGHFFAAAAEAMRRILVEDARRRHRAKYGGELNRLPLAEISAPADGHDLVALDEALDQLAEEDPLAAKVVELRYFAGQTLEQIAQTLELTVYRTRQKWTYARAWLRHAVRTH